MYETVSLCDNVCFLCFSFGSFLFVCFVLFYCYSFDVCLFSNKGQKGLVFQGREVGDGLGGVE